MTAMEEMAMAMAMAMAQQSWSLEKGTDLVSQKIV